MSEKGRKESLSFYAVVVAVFLFVNEDYYFVNEDIELDAKQT